MSSCKLLNQFVGFSAKGNLDTCRGFTKQVILEEWKTVVKRIPDFRVAIGSEVRVPQ